MVVAAVLLVIVATIWALARFVDLSHQAQPPPTAADFLAAAAALFVGWGLGLLLWGVAEILRRVEDLLASPGGLSATHSTGAHSTTVLPWQQQPDKQSKLLEELVHLTRELRDIELLSEEERAARLRHEADELVRQLEHDIPALLREHNLSEAQRRLQAAQQRFPNLPQWQTLGELVEQARAKFEAHDLARATREVDELIALGAWDRAAEVVRDLRQRHPHAEGVAELARRVTVGRDRVRAEERARLMSRAQEATNRRDWKEALRLVELIIAQYPESAEAHDLRLQLPTLRANVEVQLRQEMEEQIRGLIQQRRFAEALRIARELVERYPHSPQAAVLREQMHKLEQRAAAARQ